MGDMHCEAKWMTNSDVIKMFDFGGKCKLYLQKGKTTAKPVTEVNLELSINMGTGEVSKYMSEKIGEKYRFVNSGKQTSKCTSKVSAKMGKMGRKRNRSEMRKG